MIARGYRHVVWFRGGEEAWARADTRASMPVDIANDVLAKSIWTAKAPALFRSVPRIVGQTQTLCASGFDLNIKDGGMLMSAASAPIRG